MDFLYIQAMRKAGEIRSILNLNMHEPINIFDSCSKLGLNVRFVDVNMEGMYIKGDDSSYSTILLSCLRPLPRRVYTCAHELGHHVFDHGTKVDEMNSDGFKSNNEEEKLVDMFAGAMLMPVVAIKAEFIKRNWNPEMVGPIEFYKISSFFGTGYTTMIVHCRANKIISKSKAENLLKLTPGKLLKTLLGNETEVSHFKIFEKEHVPKIIDLEVNNYIILPNSIYIENNNLEEFRDISIGKVYKAKKAGILRGVDDYNSCFIRVQNEKYVGLAEYRHLEN